MNLGFLLTLLKGFHFLLRPYRHIYTQSQVELHTPIIFTVSLVPGNIQVMKT